MSPDRNDIIEITGEERMARLPEQFTRRRLMQLAGVSGASFIAGCGGGGQATPARETERETSTPAAQDTVTTGESAEATPTETPTEGETADGETVETPTGEVTITDQWYYDVSSSNFENLNPNPWNNESGFLSPFQTIRLSTAPGKEISRGASAEKALSEIYPMAATRFEVDSRNNAVNIHLRDDLRWGDGTEFTAENVIMHGDIIQSQFELGETGESSLPVSMEAVDKHTVHAQLLPGNTALRLQQALWGGSFRLINETHPELHRPFVESLRDATTQQELQTAIKELFTATFPAEDLPKMTLGGFKPTDWDPNGITLEARPDFPWGLHYNPDLSRIYKGVQVNAIGEEQSDINAASAGKKTWIRTGNQIVPKRFGDDWKFFKWNFGWNYSINFSPKSWGKKTEKARKMRKGLAYLFDCEEAATIGDLAPVYEETTGFTSPRTFDGWIDKDDFLDSWTNYGMKETGYVFEEKGNQAFREAGFERNKNGMWVDVESGDPLAPTAVLKTMAYMGLTRPVSENIIEQLNRNGIAAKGKIFETGSEQYVNAASNYDFDLLLSTGMCEMRSHPYFAYREDCGLGSRQGLPTAIGEWDWRNGHRRVTVPMPVGNTDGEPTRMDYDSLVKGMPQITDPEDMITRARTLSWILNQWVPMILIIRLDWLVGLNLNQVNIDNVNRDLLTRQGSSLYGGFFRPR